MKPILLYAVLFPISLFAQGYTSYFTGNITNITTIPEFGICMMGGATEHDNAMRWLLQKANGGDILVLRSSGSDGYNDYLYSELGEIVNSVETLVITSMAGATNPYVLNKVANAEMIWFAGGDQYDYVSYFKDNALENLLNAHINVKQAPIGGTSAGMAILGATYFSAQNGTVTSAQALANPYHANVTLGIDDFLHMPFMSDVITDTHYDNPDRRGRQSVFLARFRNDLNMHIRGIACNEYVAVCIGTDGIAHVYGDYPNYQEFAYFIQDNCNNSVNVENCQPNTPLTWNYNGEALKVYKVPGTMTGTYYFDVNSWENAIGSGGSWENWSVTGGVLATIPGNAPDCLLANEVFGATDADVYPNPFENYIDASQIQNARVEIFDISGKSVFNSLNLENELIDTSLFSNGLYFIRIEKNGKEFTEKLLKY